MKGIIILYLIQLMFIVITILADITVMGIEERKITPTISKKNVLLSLIPLVGYLIFVKWNVTSLAKLISKLYSGEK